LSGERTRAPQSRYALRGVGRQKRLPRASQAVRGKRAGRTPRSARTEEPKRLSGKLSVGCASAGAQAQRQEAYSLDPDAEYAARTPSQSTGGGVPGEAPRPGPRPEWPTPGSTRRQWPGRLPGHESMARSSNKRDIYACIGRWLEALAARPRMRAPRRSSPVGANGLSVWASFLCGLHDGQ